jgi:hypothetical protein
VTPGELTQSVADYMATRVTPWADESLMREAVAEAVRLLTTEAAWETMKVIAHTNPEAFAFPVLPETPEG